MYDPYCNCPSNAGIPAWAIAIVVLVVLFVAVAIFFIYMYSTSHMLKCFFNLLAQEKEVTKPRSYTYQ